MNKKFLLGMFAVAGMLLATSCSNDELDIVQSSNEAQISFYIGLEGNIATRAISDGTNTKKLVCAVYDANLNLLDQINVNGSPVDNNGQFVDEAAFDGGLSDKVNVTLAKGQTYTVAFWAQNKDCAAYTTTDLKNVTVNYTGFNNEENRDAFFAAETFKVTENTEINITLKRPFAQINVGVTDADWTAAVASGVTIENSSVVIENAATAMNVLDGSVSGETAVTYELAAKPSETLQVDTNGDGVKEDFHWLSMSYILAAEANTGYEKTTLDALVFTFNPTNGENIELKKGLTNVPVQRNWRTNILGKLLTSDIQFNIVIDPAYIEDYNYPEYNSDIVSVSTADELVSALQAGKKVLMVDDIVVPENTVITIANGVESSLDLNGLTLSSTNTRSTTSDFILVKGTLNVKNGTITYEHTGTNMGWNGGLHIFDITSGGVLNINDAVVNNLGGTDMNFAVHLNNWGEVTLNADKCEFLSTYCGVRVFNSGPNMNNVNISNSRIAGLTRAFWVHNYIGDGTASDKTLNINILNRNNTFEVPENVKSPIRYGFANPAYYLINENEILMTGATSVTYVKYNGDATEVVIPAEVEGVPVTATAGSAFAYSNVQKVTFPTSLKTLGGYTFQECTSLNSVELPEGLETIGNRAFRKCTSLKEVALPNSLVTVVESAFQQSGIESITVPENVTYIGKTAFGACGSLKTIKIEAKDVTIGHYCARACAKLESVYIYSDNVTFESGSMYFTNKENADASGITFYVKNQTIADALYNALVVSHSYGLKIVSIDGTTEYYNTL